MLISIAAAQPLALPEAPMDSAFLVCFVVGVVALAGTVVVGGFGPDAHPSDGLPFLSLTGLATAIFGFGAGGGAARLLGTPHPMAITVGIATAAVLVGAFGGLLVPYLRRQESNSHFGRMSYLGRVGIVEMSIPVGGWGEISVADPHGGRARLKARSPEGVVLAAHTEVVITDLDSEFVQVVAVPDME